MKIAIFLHGTTIMHKSALGQPREVRVKQVIEEEGSVRNYEQYVPIGNAVKKLHTWKSQETEIVYVSSHETIDGVEKDKSVLKKYNFPEGEVLFRKGGENYKHVIERLMPDVLIEDDCESMGETTEMIYPNLKPGIKRKIKSIIVKEFQGIDHLPDSVGFLMKYV